MAAGDEDEARELDSGRHTQPGVPHPGKAQAGRRNAVTHIECPVCTRGNAGDANFCAGCGHQFGSEGVEDPLEGGADPLLGRVIAERYRIEELIGRGGMGVVYRVEHVRINKLMAMKLLHGALVREKDVIKRFKREAEAVSRLDHPNTVQVFDFGQSEGMMYLVMEYLPGRDVGQLVKDDGPMEFTRVARIGAQVCGSVQQAHELGIIHRDLKPENVMVLEEGPTEDFVKVLDFGLAKLRETEEAAEKSITRAGSILGTPYYMAPEHIRGEEVDARSDVYAMGALMYKATTGVPPFWASTPVGVLTMHLTEEVEPPSQRAPKRNIPPEADAILCRAMEKDPADRFQSMDELRAELLAYLHTIGQDSGLESGRLARIGAGGASMPTKSGRQRKLATRGDVDGYERQIRRRSLFGSLLLALLVVGAIGAGAYAWTRRPQRAVTTETEPNDQLTQPDPLPNGTTFTAYLGERIDEDRSDADIFLLSNPGGERRTVSLSVSAIPNMDITLELYREGIRTPVLTAESGGIGQPEEVPNFVIDGDTYYLRVREFWESGRLPTENVSDAYEVRWDYVTPEDDDEEEVNDSIERASDIAAGDRVRGYIGWGGDEDVYCLNADAERLVARLEGISTLDLYLSRVSRTTGRVTTFDDNAEGGDEQTDALESASAGAVCFEVGARRPKEGLANSASERYTLTLEEEPEASEP